MFTATLEIFRFGLGTIRLRILRIPGLEEGTEGALIEFTAPEESVLLSDYVNWHRVLNDTFLGTEHEFQNWLRDRDKNALHQSWEKIFTPSLINAPKRKRPIPVQATVERVHLSQVTRVEFFKAQ